MIRLENVSKTYYSRVRAVPVLSEISIQVSRGSLLLLQGPSGAGKTTLLNIMGCLIRPTEGRVVIMGKDASLPEHFLCGLRRKHIGFIFQQFNLISGHTLLENVFLPLLPMGMSPKQREDMAREELSLLSIEDKRDFDVKDLSGGEQQRAAIARALVNNPDIILADEPTSNIDSKNAEFVIALLKTLKKEGKAIVVSSHDPRFAETGLADRVFRLE